MLSSGPDTGEVGTYALGVEAMASEKHTLQWLALLGFLNFVLALLFQTYYDHFLLLIFSHRLSLVLMC